MKKWSLTIILALTVVLVAACGNNSNTNTAAEPTAGTNGGTASSAQNSLEAVKASGKLRIGTEGTYAPFTYHDTAGKLTGFDVEIAEEVAKRLGVEAEFLKLSGMVFLLGWMRNGLMSFSMKFPLTKIAK